MLAVGIAVVLVLVVLAAAVLALVVMHIVIVPVVLAEVVVAVRASRWVRLVQSEGRDAAMRGDRLVKVLALGPLPLVHLLAVLVLVTLVVPARVVVVGISQAKNGGQGDEGEAHVDGR